MRPAVPFLLCIVLAIPCAAAERQSWNKIRYIGGTVPVEASRYDWNTTLTFTQKPESVVIVIAPAKIFHAGETIRFKPAQVVSLSAGPAAWRRVADVPGAHLPDKPPSLFGLLQDYALMGIVYDKEDGTRGAILLETQFSWRILPVLSKLSGKPIEATP